MNSLTEDISSKIAFSICKSKDKSSEEFAVLKYGVFVVVHVIAAAILTVLFGTLTNTLFPMVTISIMGAIMKRCSGGAHCTSPNRCLVTGVMLSYLFALMGNIIINLQVKISYIIILIVLVHSFIILYKKCPVGSKNKPLKKEETRKKLRKNAFFIYSMCIVLFILNILLTLKKSTINLNFLVVFISLGLYMQTLSLTSRGNNFILFIDKALLRLKI